ncbi:MAG: beta-N-acetylhexosaminidase [Lachnospiraceae bacterium]|nr:beta-N-acetylhexosaminidase [Lachnospiraceae bacterium]
MEFEEEDDDEEEDEIEEDEDEEDEDEIEEEDEDEEEYDEEEDRRAYRRRRRIRNQIIVYLVIFVVAAGIAGGGIMVGRKAASFIKQKKQAAEEEKAKEAAEQEQPEEELVIDTPEPVEEELEEEEDILGGLAESYYSEMSIENKVAGLFMVTPEAITGVGTATQAGSGTQEALSQYAVGGLIYFGQNILDKEQITGMLANTASMSNYPIFLAVDEEGGDVSRVANSKVEVTKVDDMASVGAGGDASLAAEAGETIGSYLKEIGFNVDFAPVADVAGEGSALGNRSFGADPQVVGEMVASAVGGIEGTGVSACLKHFPGLGSTSEDTHDGRVEITKSIDEMRVSDFVPFSAGIEAGADFVMVSHATAPALDEDNVPSSLSKKVITDILRGELGFEGVVITDALDMTAITDYYTPEEAAVMALEAGADMLLMPEDFEKAYEAVLAAVQEGTISEERIDESLNRIYRVKCAGKLEN